MTENSIDMDSLFLPIQEINEYSKGRSVTIFARGIQQKRPLGCYMGLRFVELLTIHLAYGESKN